MTKVGTEILAFCLGVCGFGLGLGFGDGLGCLVLKDSLSLLYSSILLGLGPGFSPGLEPVALGPGLVPGLGLLDLGPLDLGPVGPLDLGPVGLEPDLGPLGPGLGPGLGPLGFANFSANRFGFLTSHRTALVPKCRAWSPNRNMVLE